mgnify:CR=1 FL=1|tara:strand:- start:1673 stop:3394 length:1722 start_codon:yes stop_codon:yes gene_type:complete
MNLYKIYLSEIKKILLKNKKVVNLNSIKDIDNIIIESPPEKFNYDFSSNAAMIIAKNTKINPRIIAEKIKEIIIKNSNNFSQIEIAGPGFLNFNLKKEAWIKIIDHILKSKKNYGSEKMNKKINIEFVSANPTGPMHVGHCRGAIFGDVLSNLLKFNGNKVTKEFYVNDYGKQIDDFAKSVFYRLRQLKFNESFPEDQNLYPGDYVKEISKKILKDKKINLDNYKNIQKTLKNLSIKSSMNMIKNDLKHLGISHDNFFYESNIVNNNLVNKTIMKLKKNKFIEEGYLQPPKGEIDPNWKKIKRLIFKSTLFGDDTDRALQKNDGSWTYFANDVAYHATKVSKKNDYLINVLGADHTGYIKRITAAVSALSKNKINLICKVCQLVKLYKNGNPFKMSKRSGDFITVNDLLKEVNKDVIRFMMLNRGNDVELDFDFDKVLEKNKENPVYYVQYCYARINSLFKVAKINKNSKIILNKNNFMPNIFEYKLLRKISEWPKIVESSSKKFEPHKIPIYLYELVTIFHSYWSKGNEETKFKFVINGQIKNKLSIKIFQLLLIVLENAMHILGVSLPKKM